MIDDSVVYLALRDAYWRPRGDCSREGIASVVGQLWSTALRIEEGDLPEAERAWHAGAGSWGGAGDVNSRSIGIELANAGPLDDFPPFPEAQMAALERLLDGILPRWGIAPAGVIAHSDMAPERKSDPGPKF